MDDAPREALDRAVEASIVCLPDLFVDHFVDLDDWDTASERVQAAVDRGGGNILDVDQQVHPGGNAANTAWALARLGCQVRLAGVTSPRVLALFEATLGRDGVDLSLVDERAEASLTTVLEVSDPPANAMLNDPGSLAELDADGLPAGTFAAIEDADAVLVANWASLREHGTALVERVLAIARQAGTIAHVDAADPSERTDADREALAEAIARTPPSAWAMSETEARTFAGEDDTRKAGQTLAEQTGTRVDVHAHDAATSHDDARAARADAFDVDHVERTTGAGDAFNAGNLLGDVVGLDAQARLTLAHAVAGCYVARAERRPPNSEDVAVFAEDHERVDEAS
jgi:ribokinase